MNQTSFSNTIASQTMRLDVTKVAGAARDLGGLCTDLFLIVIRMREAEDLGDPASLRKLILYFINLFEKNCAAMKISEEFTNYAKYALVALMDETVLSIPGECRDFWLSRPIQLDLFGDNVAGEEFYKKLDSLLAQPEKAKDVLEIYYLCLSLGFEGKYKLFNAEERVAIIDNVGRTLRRVKIRSSSNLSPHGKRTNFSEKAEQRFTKFIPLWLYGCFASAVVVILYIALFVLSETKLNQILSTITG